MSTLHTHRLPSFGSFVSPEREDRLALDFVMPAQLRFVRRDFCHLPYWRLLVAVLQDACEIYTSWRSFTDPERRQEYLEAKIWIESDDTGTLGFAFMDTCELLGINAARLRCALREARQRVG